MLRRRAGRDRRVEAGVRPNGVTPQIVSRSSRCVPPNPAIGVRRVLLTCASGATPDNDCVSPSHDPGPGAHLPALVVPHIAEIIERAMLIYSRSPVRHISLAITLAGSHIARITRSPVWPDIPD